MEQTKCVLIQAELMEGFLMKREWEANVPYTLSSLIMKATKCFLE